MAFGYKIMDPSGKTLVVVSEDKEHARQKVFEMQGKWEDYCERNWLNDSGDLFSPEIKVKRFLDSLAYYFLTGDMFGIETDYKRVMHAKREIPASSCPSYVENILYSTGGTTSLADREEAASFKVMTDELDKKAEKYETQKITKKRQDSLFQKKLKLGITGGEWCAVDTENKFWFGKDHYLIDEKATQYQPVETEYGDYYAMDKILASGGKFYDMNYDAVKVYRI